MLYLTDPTSHQHDGAPSNLGDEIIKEAVAGVLEPRFDLQWIPIDQARSLGVRLTHNDTLILAGANIIGNLPLFNHAVWRPKLRNLLDRPRTILFGVGWWQYQKPPDPATRLFYRHVLSKAPAWHSVRDSYTAAALRQCGVANVINTSCPTLWNVPDELQFQPMKADAVVFTLTDYKRDSDRDQALLVILADAYRELIFFPQGSGDVAYLQSLTETNAIRVLPRVLAEYDAVLKGAVDYVGTRLHSGIRALQHGRRAFIISVDNRATEIARDTGLPVIERNDLSCLRPRIESEFSLRLKIDRDAIRRYRDSLTA